LDFLAQNYKYMGLLQTQWFFCRGWFFKISTNFYHNVKQKDYVENNIHHHQSLVMYNKKNGTITMNRHVFNEHFDVLNLNNAKRLDTITPISIDAQWSSKKWKSPTTHSIASFFCFGVPYKKFDLAPEKIVEDLCFYITKGYHLLKSIKRVKTW